VNLVAEHFGVVTMCSTTKFTVPIFCCFRCVSLQYLYINSFFTLIVINGCENKCTTVIIITCKLILTCRSRLSTYKRLVSKFESLVSAGEAVSISSRKVRVSVSYQALTSRAHPWGFHQKPRKQPRSELSKGS